MNFFNSFLPTDLMLNQVSLVIDGANIEIKSASCQNQSQCPLCSAFSSKVHSHYNRCLADLSVSGYSARVILKARKFVCNNIDCKRRIFTERFSSQIKPFGRRFNRTTDLITRIGLELGGNKGAKICGTIGCQLSPSTVLRNIHKVDLVEPGKTSGVIGVDDWAFKKGRNYGTIIVDLISKKVIDLLPDREADTLTAWLVKHPEIKIVSRDRASAYSLGIRNGAPQATQVADRFHLLVNLRDAFQKTLQKQSSLLKESFSHFSNPENTNPLPEENKHLEKPESLFSGSVSVDRQFKFEKAKELHQKGYKIKAIARHLKAARKTVRKYIQLSSLQGKQNPETSPSYTNFKHFESYLLSQYKPGITFKALFKAIQNQGFNGKYTSFCDRMHKLLNGKAGTTEGKLLKLNTVKTWSTSKLAFMALGNIEELEAKDREFLDFLYGKSPILKLTVALALKFKGLFHSKSEGSLDSWLKEALMPESELKWFAKGIKADYEAVNQAVVSSISNGQVEGHVNKLKTIKRNMYGRAGFGLLKRMILMNSC